MARTSRTRVIPLAALLLAACGGTPQPIQHQSPLVAPSPIPADEVEPSTPEPVPLTAVEPAAFEPVPPPVEPSPPPLFVEIDPADRPGAPTKTSCRVVAHIGDSTSTGMMKEYYVPDPAQRLDAQLARIGVQEAYLELFGGRSLVEHRAKNENGMMVAQRLRDAGFRGCWVVALGTNDAANVAKGSNVDRVERIEKMMAIIGDDPVLWVDAVTVTEDGWWASANMRVWNDDLAATLQRYPNARIYRWSQDIRDEWFVSDGIHYNKKGYAARAELTAEALAAAFPGG